MMNEELGPFIYGKTVTKFSYTNRELESEKLTSNLIHGVNTMLISPRRWGKSSLVEKTMSGIKTNYKNQKIVMIDLFSTANQHEFLQLFAREVIKASSSKWEEWITIGKTFFKQIVPTLSIGIDPITDFSIGFDWKELEKYPDEVLSLPERIAAVKSCRFIICLDEFQNLAEFDNYLTLEKKMRAVWQTQKLTTYCLYGSKRHMMTEIFNKPSKPFYRFGDIILLEKIKRDRWVSFISKNFSRTKKKISKVNAEMIPTLMKDHSWYVQQLSHYAWQKTVDVCTEETIFKALMELIYANSPLYYREIEIFSKKQLNLLKAIAAEERQLTSAKALAEFDLGTSASVIKNKKILIESDVIHEQNGKVEFLDPAFEIWFKNKFFGEKIGHSYF